MAVVNTGTNDVVYLEDIKFDNIKTVKARLEVIKTIYDSHHFLKAGFWKSVKVALKTHKYTLVPTSHFDTASAKDYLAVSAEIRNNIEDVFHYKHLSTDAVNIYAGDKVLIEWLNKTYPEKQVDVIHQGSALIEGILHYNDHSHEKSMFCFFDRGVLHIVVTRQRKLVYYNQFGIKQAEDYLKYIMLVFKELALNQKSTKVIMWGFLKQTSPQIKLFKKYIRNIGFGSRPQNLNFTYHFDEIADHQFFDLLNIHLCE
jgi:hypothetical protein